MVRRRTSEGSRPLAGLQCPPDQALDRIPHEVSRPETVAESPHARHAISIDENRAEFNPVRWIGDEAVDGNGVRRFEQVWFAGNHSDVGAAIRKTIHAFRTRRSNGCWMPRRPSDWSMTKPG
ncbi:T6SS phospholipase effector Tle1-like catalytic domain-containing protein [Allomesorhizobium camelthorni]|uniref:T6SS phospholipase effector Tle1-like catalytic domain-containing protein n=1 Tax=Allomesorhizobium camelthorni TaxID=475069 RepID=UPI001FEB78C9|nr:DUF2235 domain-containing protein [Mesorhizobium camelthorni]